MINTYKFKIDHSKHVYNVTVNMNKKYNYSVVYIVSPNGTEYRFYNDGSTLAHVSAKTLKHYYGYSSIGDDFTNPIWGVLPMWLLKRIDLYIKANF